MHKMRKNNEIFVLGIFFLLPFFHSFSVLITIIAEHIEMSAFQALLVPVHLPQTKIIRAISRRSNDWKHCLTFDTSESR